MRALAGRVRRLLGLGSDSRPRPHSPSAVWLMQLEGRCGKAGTLRRLSPPGHFWQPMLDRAGDDVVYWGRRPEDLSQHVWLSELQNTKPLQLTFGPGTAGHPAWFPDGRRIIYFRSSSTDWQPAKQFNPDRPPAALWVLDRSTGQETQLTDGLHVDERPVVSPDGEEILFVSNRSGHLNLWRISSHGDGLRQVTHGDGPDYRPAFSADGRTVAYFTPSADGSHQLELMSWPEARPLGFSMNRRLAWVHGPCWSADGRTLLAHALAVDDRRPRLWLIDVRAGEAVPLELPGASECSHGSWDAAERWISFDSRAPLD